MINPGLCNLYYIYYATFLFYLITRILCFFFVSSRLIQLSIRKYGGMSGVSSTMPSIPPSVSQSNSFSNSSSLSKSVRNEAMKVLEIKGNDDAYTLDVNQPFNVRRTESGGFSCKLSNWMKKETMILLLMRYSPIMLPKNETTPYTLGICWIGLE